MRKHTFVVALAAPNVEGTREEPVKNTLLSVGDDRLNDWFIKLGAGARSFCDSLGTREHTARRDNGESCVFPKACLSNYCIEGASAEFAICVDE